MTFHTSTCSRRSGRGFTLIELMIALAIVGILAAIAYPSYTEQVRRGKRAEAESVMLEAAQYLQRYYAAHNSYSGADLSTPGLDKSPKGSADGAQEYDLSVDVPNNNSQTYTINADLADGKSDSRCGNLRLTDTGRKSATATGAGSECWR